MNIRFDVSEPVMGLTILDERYGGGVHVSIIISRKRRVLY
jgi:hypothetical protein